MDAPRGRARTTKGSIQGGPQATRKSPGVEGGRPYFRRTRVPLIFWELRVFRKLGSTLSISSK